jgi:hypothetical protein
VWVPFIHPTITFSAGKEIITSMLNTGTDTACEDIGCVPAQSFPYSLKVAEVGMPRLRALGARGGGGGRMQTQTWKEETGGGG